MRIARRRTPAAFGRGSPEADRPRRFAAPANSSDLTGKDRAVMYTLAQRTGLRRNELRSLTPGSSTWSPIRRLSKSKRQAPNGGNGIFCHCRPTWRRPCGSILPADRPTRKSGPALGGNGRPTCSGGLRGRGIAAGGRRRPRRRFPRPADDLHYRPGPCRRHAGHGPEARAPQRHQSHAWHLYAIGDRRTRGGRRKSSRTPHGPPLSCTTDQTPLVARQRTQSQDPELDRLIASWPRLSAPIRRAILALLGSQESDPSRKNPDDQRPRACAPVCTYGRRCVSLAVIDRHAGGLSRPRPRKTKPLAGQGVWHCLSSVALIVKAEGKGFEPSTGCPAPDFESGC